MAIQAPAPGIQGADPLQTQLGEVRITADIGRALGIGSALQVEVAFDPNQPDQKKLGVLIDGKFYPALLPDSVALGEELKVRVLDNSDALILKIIGPKDPAAAANDPKLAALKALYPKLFQDIEALVQETPAKELQRILFPLREEFGKLLLLKSADSQAASPSSTSAVPANQAPLPLLTPPSIADPLAKIFDKILASGAVLDSKILEKPELTYDALLKGSTSSLLKTLSEAKEALQKLSATKLPPQQMQFIKALEEEIRSILTQQTAPPAQVPLKIAQSNAATPVVENSLPQTEAQIDLRLALVVEVLKKVKHSKPESSKQEAEFRIFLKEFTAELELALQKKIPEASKELLSKALRTIQERFQAQQFAAEDSNKLQSGMRALTSLENLVQAQETLSQLNPMMEALGEPVFILFPIVAEGLLSKINLAAQNPQITPDQGRKRRSRADQYEKVGFQISLPALGEVEVQLAHRKEELLLSITVASEEIKTFIQPSIEKLNSRFSALGYKSIEVQAKVGTPTDLSPGWVKELRSRPSVVA